jgi:hypothetical protein
MEWFWGTTLGCELKYHFWRMVKSLDRQTSGLHLQSHGSGGREEGGITISRRPNNRPSREKAPGPSNVSAAAVTIIPQATSLASCKPQEGAGNQERAIPRKHNPIKSPANGVKNPAARARPLVIKSKPRSHLPEEGLDGPKR